MTIYEYCAKDKTEKKITQSILITSLFSSIKELTIKF